MTNNIQKFLFNNLGVRGVVVQLDTAWQEVLKRRSYAPHLAEILGEATVATLLMSANVKFDGQLMLQLQSQGDLPLLIVQSDNQQQFRALARHNNESRESLTAMTPQGIIAIMIEANIGDEPYQGVVSIDADSMAENIETYFNQSEQLQTLLILRANNQQAAGLLLQVLPDAHIADDDWIRLRHMAETLNLAELQNIDSETLISRLFAEDDKTVFPATAATFQCACSDERTLSMLASLDESELKEIADSNKTVSVSCDFCGKIYEHDAATVAALLSNKIHPN